MLYRLLGICFAIGMFFSAWEGHVENKAFQLYGQKAYIEPIDKYIVKTETYKSKQAGGADSVVKSNIIDAYFRTVDNHRVKIISKIPQEVVSRVINGENVQITYVSNDPTMVRFDNQSANTASLGVIGIVILFFSLKRRS
jgi:hypothetical protein